MNLFLHYYVLKFHKRKIIITVTVNLFDTVKCTFVGPLVC